MAQDNVLITLSPADLRMLDKYMARAQWDLARAYGPGWSTLLVNDDIAGVRRDVNATYPYGGE